MLLQLTLITLLSATAGTSRGADDFDALVTSFEEEHNGWQARLDEIEDLRERAALRKAHPASEYWERFRACGEGGEGRAWLWMIEHVGDAGVARKERAGVKSDLYERLFSGHAGADWFGDVIRRVPRDARDLGDEFVEAKLTPLMGADEAQTAGLATLTLGSILAGSKDEAASERGEELLEAYEEKYISVGAQAIDFTGTTFEGHEFKLSDYKGKVVLLDFYGFW